MSGVSPGVVASGAEVLLQLRHEVDTAGRFVVRIPRGHEVTFAISLGHALGTRRDLVRMVVDPTLQPGYAAWMRPFTVPYQVIIVLASDADEALAWAGSRGLSYGLHRDATSVFGAWEPADLERLTAEYHGQGVAAVVLKGWSDRFGSPNQLDVEMVLHPGWTPDGVPAGWGPVGEDDRRHHIETMLLGVVSGFGGQVIVASPQMEQMVRDLADVAEQLSREGWLPKAEKVASAPTGRV